MSIEKMKQALEALATEEYRLRQTGQSQVYPGIGSAITFLREAIEQYEKQKPIAWFWFDVLEDEWKHLADNQADADKYLPNKVVPFYITPPQREWCGLTDEDRQRKFVLMGDEEGQGLNNYWKDAFTTGSLWVEAKLKERNHVS